jgi:diacylglycerol kinase
MQKSLPSLPPRQPSFLRSLGFAWDGIRLLVRTQRNARIHLAFTVMVTAAGLWCQLQGTQWALIFVAMGLVWTAEGLNTALEFLTDLVSPEYHALAGKAKDVAAGAVLLAVCAAVGIGCSVFWPYLTGRC